MNRAAEKKISRNFLLFLIPPILQGLVSFLMLPLITFKLGPKEFGIYAMANLLILLGSSIATMGSNYTFSEKLMKLDSHEQSQLISTNLTISILVQLALCLLLGVGWKLYIGRHTLIPTAGFYCVLATMILMTYSQIAIDVLTIQKRADSYGIMLGLQTVSTAFGMWVSLYQLDLGLLSLFIAPFIGAASASAWALVAIRKLLTFRLSTRWAKKIISIGLPASFTTLSENAQTFIERTVLSFTGGYSTLGLYTNAQQYRNLINMSIKALARTIWPWSLEEANDTPMLFNKTERLWNLAYLAIALVIFFVISYGDFLIGLLTHDKFTNAYHFFVIMLIGIMIQNSGKPQTAWFYASGRLKGYMSIQVFSMLIGSILTGLFGLLFGVWGVLSAVISQQLIMRLAIQVRSSKTADIRFSDGLLFALVGLVSISYPLSLGLPFIKPYVFFIFSALSIILAYRMNKFSISTGKVSNERNPTLQSLP